MSPKSSAIIAIAFATAAGGLALAAQDRSTLKVPDGLAFSEFKGYEGRGGFATPLPETINVSLLHYAAVHASRMVVREVQKRWGHSWAFFASFWALRLSFWRRHWAAAVGCR